jgi:hypothetical protein
METTNMVGHQIALRHFGRSTVNALARKGIRFLGPTAVPDASGSFLNSETGYKMDDNGTGRIWMVHEVRENAR